MPTEAPSSAAIAELALAREFLVPVMLCCLIATLPALVLLNVFQKDLDPVRAAIIYALEPVWATIFAEIGRAHV